MAGKVFAYVRCSTDRQDCARQKTAIEGWARSQGTDIDRWFEEYRSGKDLSRPEFQDMLGHLREDDTVVVSELSRISRSLRDLLNITDGFKEGHIEFVSVRENIELGSASGKLMLSLLGSFAEFERDIISERTKAGLKETAKRGRKGGRKPKDPEAVARALRLREEGKMTIREIEKATGVSKGVIYKHLHAGEKGGASQGD